MEFRVKKRLGHEFRVVHNKINRYISCFISEIGKSEALTQPQCHILGYLMAHKDADVFQRDIENEFDISRATATNTLQVMERHGLIMRVGCPEDARLKKLVITDKGRDVFELFVPYFKKMDNQITKGFSGKEIEQLYDFLKRIQKNLDPPY